MVTIMQLCFELCFELQEDEDVYDIYCYKTMQQLALGILITNGCEMYLFYI